MAREQALTQQQIKFAENYAGGMSLTHAYADAYGIENLGKWNEDPRYDACSTNGSRLIKNPKVKALVLKLQKDVYEGICLNAEKIAIKLADMAFADKDDEVYTPQVQQKALDMLQKQLGLQKQKIDADVNHDVEIKVTIEED